MTDMIELNLLNKINLLDAMPDPMWLSRFEDGVFLTVNQAFIDTLGYQKDEIIGKSALPSGVGIWADINHRRQWLDMHQSTDHFVKFEAILQTKSGGRVNVLLSSRTVRIDGNLYVTGTIQNVKKNIVTGHCFHDECHLSNRMIMALGLPTFIINKKHEIITWNDACEALTGVKSTEILGTKDAWRGFYDSQRPCLANYLVDEKFHEIHLAYPVVTPSKFVKEGIRAEGWFTGINGKQIYIVSEASPIYDQNGNVIAAIQTVEDITERKLAEEMQTIAAAVFDASHEAIIITTPDHVVVSINTSFNRLTGYEPEDIVGSPSDCLRTDQEPVSFYEDICKVASVNGIWQGRMRKRKKCGEHYLAWVTIRAIKDDDNNLKNHIWFITDITAQIETSEKLHNISNFDDLTGLPNRAMTLDRLSKAIEQSTASSSSIAALCVNLDNFKALNDALGHKVGNDVLKDVAFILQGCVRANDIVSRVSGDEYLMIILESTPQGAGLVAKKVISSIASHHFVSKAQPIKIRCSIGVACYPGDGLDAGTLIKNAGIALYSAKKSRRGGYQFYEKSMNDDVEKRFIIENELHIALEQGDLAVYYQPQIDVASGKIIGAEALVRWIHPDRGIIHPGEFIAIAEESTLIASVGEFVLRRACHDLKSWIDEGLPTIEISVNVSMRQLHADRLLLPILKSVLRETKLPSGALTLELTESVMVEDDDILQTFMEKARKLGVRFAIDDFGTGYSNLKSLNSLTIDKLKIDSSFIRDITERPDSYALLQTIVKMADSFNVDVVAEGVENEHQLMLVQESGCKIVQGYYYSKPLPAQAFKQMLIDDADRSVQPLVA